MILAGENSGWKEAWLELLLVVTASLDFYFLVLDIPLDRFVPLNIETAGRRGETIRPLREMR